jgi:hypothetical protein
MSMGSQWQKITLVPVAPVQVLTMEVMGTTRKRMATTSRRARGDGGDQLGAM